MKVIIVPSPEQMGKEAGAIVAAGMASKPRFVLGLATGSTPIPLYQDLIRRHGEEGLDFSTTTAFNLDEYVGLEPTHPQSYRFFMQSELLDRINIDEHNFHIPDGMTDDVDAHCLAYEADQKRWWDRPPNTEHRTERPPRFQ